MILTVYVEDILTFIVLRGSFTFNEKSHRCILRFYFKINIKDKNQYIFSHVCKPVCRSDIKVNMQSCQFGKGSYFSFTLSINNKQEETDQGTFREESFTQNSSWFSVRSEKRANFLRVQNPRSKIHKA